MNYRLSEQSILSVLHPNAKEMFDQGGSLKDICYMMANPERAVSDLDVILLCISFICFVLNILIFFIGRQTFLSLQTSIRSKMEPEKVKTLPT